MSRDSIYHTKQKDKILECIKTYHGDFTIKDIYLLLDKNIGLTTIYRTVDQLVNEGRLNKVIGEDNTFYYQYLEECNRENHFFLKCNNCGEIIHVDCDCVNNLFLHITKKHKFVANHDKIIIYGLCDNCRSLEVLK